MLGSSARCRSPFRRRRFRSRRRHAQGRGRRWAGSRRSTTSIASGGQSSARRSASASLIAGSESDPGRRARILKPPATDYADRLRDPASCTSSVAQRTGDQLDGRGLPLRPAGQNLRRAASFVGDEHVHRTLSLAPGHGPRGGPRPRGARGRRHGDEQQRVRLEQYGWSFGPEGSKSSLGGLFLYSERSAERQSGRPLPRPEREVPGDATRRSRARASSCSSRTSATTLMGGTVTANVPGHLEELRLGRTGPGRGLLGRRRRSSDEGARPQAAGRERLGNEVRLRADDSARRSGASTDEKGKGVDWSSYSLQQGGFKFAYGEPAGGREVHSLRRPFRGRPRSTRQGDRPQPEEPRRRSSPRSRASSRSAAARSWTTRPTSSAIRREARGSTRARSGCSFGEQKVDKAFARVGSLTGDGAGQMGREVGCDSASGTGLTAALGGKKTPQDFSPSTSRGEDRGGRSPCGTRPSRARPSASTTSPSAAQGKTLPMNSLGDAESKAYTKRIGSSSTRPRRTTPSAPRFLGDEAT